MTSPWKTLPLWALVEESRQAVEPTELGDEVMLYSIPGVDATGTGQVEKSETIKSAKLLLHGGEVLVSKLNPRKSRVVHVRPSTLPIVSSTEFVGLRSGSMLDSAFLGYLLQSESVRQNLDARVQSVTRSHQRVDPSDITHLSVMVPGIAEQRRIVRFLDAETSRVGSIGEARDAQVRCLEELWESRLASWVDDLIARYGLLPLRRVVGSIEQGWSPQCEDVIASPSEWAVLKTSAVSSGTFNPLEHKKLPDGVSPDLRYQVSDGDILLTRGSGSSAHVGVSAVAHPEGRRLLLSDLLYRIRLVHDWSPEFIAYILRSQPIRGFMALLFRGQSGQTIKLRAGDIRSIDVPATPPHLQAQFAVKFAAERESIQSAITGLRKTSGLLAERRAALITAAVTGQIDVSTAGGRGIED